MAPRTVKHPFGGCDRLLDQYRGIGGALLRVEFRRSSQLFREAVAVVPVEVLESYLDDLLDVSIKDEALYIKRDLGIFKAFVGPGAGLVMAVGAGLYAASEGATLGAAFAMTILAALPFALMLHFAPRYGLMRRMGFAQVVSAEISRRRGRDKGDDSSSRVIFPEVWAGHPSSAIQGAAKKLYH